MTTHRVFAERSYTYQRLAGITWTDWAGFAFPTFANMAPSASKGGLASTFQYSVSGDGYHSATQVQISFTVNVPASRRSGLKLLSTYAKTLSENTAFTISKAMLQDVARGKTFSKAEKTYKVSFKVQHLRKDQHVLQVDKLGTNAR